MRTIRNLSELQTAPLGQETVVAIGKFDGVHRGHAAILKQATELAKAHGLLATVFTFTQNPLAVIAPEKHKAPLMSPEQRLERFAENGIDVTVMVDFDDALRQMSPAEYVENVLVKMLHVKHLLVGADFRFGHRGAGDVETLKKLGQQHGFEVLIVDDITADEKRVSSTVIRDLIMGGKVAQAADLLGRPVELRGEVVHGAKRGRDLGFPTANLAPDHEGLAPGDGVYAGWAVLPDGSRYKAAISVGTNPTFVTENKRTVEAYLLDFDADLYGQTIRIQFTQKLRGNIAFESVDDLITQMHQDIAETRKICASQQ